MASKARTSDIISGRLSKEAIEENFSDRHPPLSNHEALVAADRCYFCHDAPCMHACPTAIDIPLFIRQISTGTPEAAAKTILDQNILGGMCARVCPTETLCEEACVREAAEGKPVIIGQLQRYATDILMFKDRHPYKRAPETGKKIAVIGAGPAGLACAHRLAMHGHSVVLYDSKSKGGGLNEFGIAAYKSTDNFAQKEMAWLLKIGGISLELEKTLGKNLSLNTLQEDFDAIFLGIGLGGVNTLALDAAAHDGVSNAVDWIAALRQTKNKADIKIGKNVVVIGGGMTAIDAGVQSKLLGAQTVTIAYRKGQENMSASDYEQAQARAKGVHILLSATPKRIEANSISFDQSGDEVTLDADQILLAIGQNLSSPLPPLKIDGGKIAADDQGRTSVDGIWAGGDCTHGGEDLTVTAVAEGRDAAIDIHRYLMEGA